MFGKESKYPHEFMMKVAHDFAKQKETMILDQLNDFISRGLIVVEETEPFLVRSSMGDKMEMKMGIRLVLKDKLYISDLEEENKKLKSQLESIKKAIQG